MVVVQHDDDSLSDEAIKTLCDEQANPGGYFLFNTTDAPESRIRTGKPVLVSGPIYLASSHRLSNQEAKLTSTVSLLDRLRKRQWNLPLLDFNEQDGSLAKSRPQESRANQSRVAGNVVPDVPIRSSDRLRVRPGPSVARALPSGGQESLGGSTAAELEEIFEPRQLGPDEAEDDETETARALSEPEKRELFRQHCNLGQRQPTELSRTLALELLNSRQRSGQRGYVDVGPEGQPMEEPPVDTRPDIHQVLGATAPASGPCSDSGKHRSCEY